MPIFWADVPKIHPLQRGVWNVDTPPCCGFCRAALTRSIECWMWSRVSVAETSERVFGDSRSTPFENPVR